MADLKHTLVVRDGKVFLLATYPLTDEPRIRFMFYPTTIAPSTLRHFGIDSGSACERRESGVYKLVGRDFLVTLPDRGDTQAVHVEEVSAPSPKVRSNVEVRWYCGRWEKFLKREGWVPA